MYIFAQSPFIMCSIRIHSIDKWLHLVTPHCDNIPFMGIKTFREMNYGYIFWNKISFSGCAQTDIRYGDGLRAASVVWSHIMAFFVAEIFD